MNNNTEHTRKKLPVRTDHELRTKIKISYEKTRMKRLRNEDPIPSLNKFICELLNSGLEALEETDESEVAMA